MKVYIAALLCMMRLLQAQPVHVPRGLSQAPKEPYLYSIGDAPFATDMTFRSCADHIVDVTQESFDPDDVQLGDVVFVMDFYLSWFMKYIHPHIREPYILVSNDSDESHPSTGCIGYDEKNGWPLSLSAVRTLLYDSKVAFWFCKNMILSRHPKIEQIPIGVNIIYWGPMQSWALQRLMRPERKERDKLLSIRMQTASNPVRAALVEQFQDASFCSMKVTHSGCSLMTPEGKEPYYQELSTSFFTLAPPGYGIDTVRVWEAVALGCMPIVQHGPLDDLYCDMPVVFVHDWQEVDEAFLQKHKDRYTNSTKDKVMYAYWHKKIRHVQQRIRQGDVSFSQVVKTQLSEADLIQLSSILARYIAASRDRILYQGSVLGLRPFQLAEKMGPGVKVFVQDRWGAWSNESASAHLTPFMDSALFVYQHQIQPINFWDDPYPIVLQGGKRMHTVLDVSYHRHRLAEDLEKAWMGSSTRSVIVGNGFDDLYVQEVVQQFSQNKGISVQAEGAFWWVIR